MNLGVSQMKLATLALSLFFSFLSFNVHGAIWEDTQEWSLEYEQKYIAWIQSSYVREKMFTDSRSPYFGVNTDCADTAYALRAVFAFENKLPFAITNPSGSRDASKTLNNRSNKFDSAGPENLRVVALITEIGDSVGTENLTRYDTFPVAIKKITPGTIFTYKIRARLRNFIRHAYNIKNINPVGTFDVIYSTQANKEKHGELLRRTDREFENAPNDPWGFRKFRWPEHLGSELSSIPKELGPSAEQFELAKELGEKDFFKFIRTSVATSSETNGERLSRLFKSVCFEAQARISYVNEALDYLNKTQNACMDYERFDAFSTPARDKALKELFLKFEESYKDAKNDKSGDPTILAFAETIYGEKGNKSELLSSCPINYRAGATIDLGTLWTRLKKERLSSHPNDIVELRWGEATKPETKCKRWY